MNQQEQRIWELLARKFSGESTHEESQELLNFAQHDPALDRMIQALELFWNDPPEEITSPDPVKMWATLQEKIDLTSRPPIIHQLFELHHVIDVELRKDIHFVSGDSARTKV
jgi:hypothetical protein